MADRYRVVAAMATTLLLWSSAFVAIRIAVAELSPHGLTLARLLVASVALVAVAPLFKIRTPARADIPRLVACALTGMAGYQFLLNAGERTVDAGTANLLVNMSPVLAAVLAWVLLGDRPRVRVWAGIGLGFTGASILAVAGGGGARLSLGALLVIGAALSQAAFFVFEKPLLGRYTGFEVTCHMTWIATISTLPAAGHLVGDITNASPATLASVVFLAVDVDTGKPPPRDRIGHLGAQRCLVAQSVTVLEEHQPQVGLHRISSAGDHRIEERHKRGEEPLIVQVTRRPAPARQAAVDRSRAAPTPAAAAARPVSPT